MFLTKSDLSTNVSPEIVALVSRYSDELVLLHLATAESELETYLSLRYHIRPELEKVGAARHKLLLKLCVNLAVFHLYSSVETVPDRIEKQYERTLKLLDYFAQGKNTLPGIPPAPVDANEPITGQMSFGYNPRRPSLLG